MEKMLRKENLGLIYNKTLSSTEQNFVKVQYLNFLTKFYSTFPKLLQHLRSHRKGFYYLNNDLFLNCSIFHGLLQCFVKFTFVFQHILRIFRKIHSQCFRFVNPSKCLTIFLIRIKFLM